MTGPKTENKILTVSGETVGVRLDQAAADTAGVTRSAAVRLI